MKLKTIAEKLGALGPVRYLRNSQSTRTLRAFLALCWENPFPMQCVLLLVYRTVLDFMYLTQLSPLFAYSGFTTDLSPVTYVLSWLMLLAFLPLVVGIQKQEDRPSSVLVTLLNFLYFIPMTSYVGCKGSSLRFMASVVVYWLVLLLLQLGIPSFSLKRISPRHGKILFLILSVGAVLLVMGISGIYTGFRLKLNISDVYSIRSEAEVYAIPSVLSYLLSWMTIVLSVLILYWLRAKKYCVVAVLIVVYFFYYSVNALKSVFFFLFLLLACYVLYRSWMLRWSAGLLSLGVMASWLFQSVGHFMAPMDLFVRRFMYVPVQLSEAYAVFFADHPLSLQRDGLLGKLGFEPVYSTTVPLVIGESVGSYASANNGMLGDLYASVPAVVGVVIFPLILVILFRAFDLATSKIPTRIFISFCAFFTITFSNASWSTTLLTHGFLVSCVLLYLFPIDKEGVIRELS